MGIKACILSDTRQPACFSAILSAMPTLGHPVRPFFDRFEEKIQKGSSDTCWPWLAGKSRSGWREVDYPHLRLGGKGTPMIRVNRLLLILKHGPTDCPILPGEAFATWILRVNNHFRAFDASHTCDNSGCCNPDHLAWQAHGQNIADQVARRRARR
jgi:hypothetical protein